MNSVHYEPAATILLADSDDDNRCLLKAVLALKGFEVLEAMDGEQAFNLTVEKRPDMLVIDLKLPVVSGITVIRRLKHAGHLGIPIIAISLATTASHRSIALAAGCVAHIEKPVEPDLFDELLNEFLPAEGAQLVSALLH